MSQSQFAGPARAVPCNETTGHKVLERSETGRGPDSPRQSTLPSEKPRFPALKTAVGRGVAPANSPGQGDQPPLPDPLGARDLALAAQADGVHPAEVQLLGQLTGGDEGGFGGRRRLLFP